MLNLLASRGLFIGLIVLVVLVVLLCIGLAALLFFKPFKTKTTVEADAIKKELYRRETELVIQIVTEKAEGEAREDLLNALRRIKWTQGLIDEIIRTEKSERGIVDKPKPVKRPTGKGAPARKSAEMRKPPVAEGAAPVNAEAAASAAEEKEEAKPKVKKKPLIKKRKDSNEFKPSDD